MKTFKKYYIIPAPPQDVYSAITNENAITIWTGEHAEMKPEPGTEFSMWEGSIVGKNVEFVPDKKVVQQWYFGEQKELSIVTLTLHEHKKGTSVQLVHTNIPDQDYQHIQEGWDNNYFRALEIFFED